MNVCDGNNIHIMPIYSNKYIIRIYINPLRLGIAHVKSYPGEPRTF
jgi:hypothetical protein